MNPAPSRTPIRPLHRSWSQLFAVRSSLTKAVALGVGLAFVTPTVFATSDTWDGTTSSLWSVNTNWLTDPAIVPGAGDTATFNANAGTVNNNTTLDLDGGVAIGAILFDTASAPHTIGAGAAGSQTLTFGDTGAAVTLNGTVTTNQLFNANLVLGTAIASTTTITNSATAASGVSLTFAGTIQGGTGGTAAVKTLNTAGTGAVNFTNALTAGGATQLNVLNIGANTTTLSGNVTSTLNTLRATAGGTMVVNGQTVTVAAQSNFGSSSTFGKFRLDSGSASFNGGIQSATASGALAGGDGMSFQVNGGTFSASAVSLGRSQIMTGLQTNPTITSGFIVTGGTASVTGAVNIAGSNSSAAGLLSGGSLTVNGDFTLGNSAAPNLGRYNVFQVSGGTFINTDTTNGIVLARNPASGNNGEFLVTGGTATVEKISFGLSTSATAGANTSQGALVLGNSTAAGTLFVGSGGIVQGALANYTSTINLTNGTLGAKADWSSTLAMNLNGAAGTAVTVQAADALNAATNITLGGAINGTGGITKTGGGILTLSGPNNYSGITNVNAGTLLLNGSNVSPVAVNSGAVLGGTGSAGDLTLNVGGGLIAGSTSDDLAASSLTWNGETSTAFSQAKFELSTIDSSSDRLALSGMLFKGTGSSFSFDFLGGGAPSTAYTLLTFSAQTGFTAGDFAFTNLAPGLSGTFAVQDTAVVFTTAVPEPSSAMLVLGGMVGILGVRRTRCDRNH